MQNVIRAFVAVDIPSEIRDRTRKPIAELDAVPSKPVIRWVDPGSMHLTLTFLGETPMLETPAICQAVKAAVADASAFEFELRGLGAFPDADRPRTIWLGVGEGTESLIDLHERVEQALVPLGFRRERRRFLPHLTLGRARGESLDASFGATLAKWNDFRAGVVSVDDVTIYSSELTRQGPIYEALAFAALSG